VIVERAVCGLGVVFYVRSENGGRYRPEQFARFASLGLAVPLAVDHEPVLTGRGTAGPVGTVRGSALLDVTSSHPAGLLLLAEVDPGAAGDALLRLVARGLDPWSGAAPWGLSFGGALDEAGEAAVGEFSLTLRPALPSARVLGVGRRALAAWELLTGERVEAA